MGNRAITLALTSDENNREKLLEVDPDIVDVEPRRSSSSYRCQESLDSHPKRAYCGYEEYDDDDDDDDYDGEQTPVATRSLIAEIPRHSRSTSRSTSASTRRSASTRSDRSTISNFTVASTNTVKTDMTTLSFTPSFDSEPSLASKLSRRSSVTTAPSSIISDSITRTYYRYRPFEDDKAFIKSYERRISGDRCPDEKERKKLQSIMRVAEYAAGRNRRYSKLN
ncbi:MAG: hypothetical protein MMC23_005734 [Stictis urceolatum]|nr:hypothetical protein [Stictis urceolata]